jgi:hypothetical protein
MARYFAGSFSRLAFTRRFTPVRSSLGGILPFVRAEFADSIQCFPSGSGACGDLFF